MTLRSSAIYFAQQTYNLFTRTGRSHGLDPITGGGWSFTHWNVKTGESYVVILKSNGAVDSTLTRLCNAGAGV